MGRLAPTMDLLAEIWEMPPDERRKLRPEIEEFAVRLLEAYYMRQEKIDAEIERLPRDWTLERMPATDRNVLRVAARLEGSRRRPSDPAARRELREALRAVYPPGRAGAFTQALMELGATVCLPNGAPLCAACPLAGLCEAHRAGTQAELPVKEPKPERRVRDLTVFLILRGGRAAVRRRPDSGLLAGMWEFPNAPGALSRGEAERALRAWGVSPESLEPLPAAKHIFTHLEWHMTGWLARAGETGGAAFAFASAAALKRDYAVPAAFRAYLRCLERLPG